VQPPPRHALLAVLLLHRFDGLPIRRRQVTKLRDDALQFIGEIGAMLGVSKQAAQRKYGTKTPA